MLLHVVMYQQRENLVLSYLSHFLVNNHLFKLKWNGIKVIAKKFHEQYNDT